MPGDTYTVEFGNFAWDEEKTVVTSIIYKRGVQERSEGLLKGTHGRKKDDESMVPQTIRF